MQHIILGGWEYVSEKSGLCYFRCCDGDIIIVTVEVATGLIPTGFMTLPEGEFSFGFWGMGLDRRLVLYPKRDNSKRLLLMQSNVGNRQRISLWYNTARILLKAGTHRTLYKKRFPEVIVALLDIGEVLSVCVGRNYMFYQWNGEELSIRNLSPLQWWNEKRKKGK